MAVAGLDKAHGNSGSEQQLQELYQDLFLLELHLLPIVSCPAEVKLRHEYKVVAAAYILYG